MYVLVTIFGSVQCFQDSIPAVERLSRKCREGKSRREEIRMERDIVGRGERKGYKEGEGGQDTLPSTLKSCVAYASVATTKYRK